MDLPFAFLTSLLWGMRHATDPDHLVAVSTIVSEERSLWRACRVGALWGAGHTLTLLLLGGAILLYKIAFHPRVGLTLEFLVALMLIGLGVLNLAGKSLALPHRALRLRPFFVGSVHGLAGSAAATLMLLPLIDDLRWATLYLLLFGVGTMAGMALATLLLAVPSVYAGARLARMEQGIRIAAGLASIGFGLHLAYQIGIVDGLFTAHPRWTPQ